MVCQQHICFNHAVYIEDWTAAGKALKNIKMLHPTEGFLKEIVLHLSKEDYGAAFEQAKSCLATILYVLWQSMDYPVKYPCSNYLDLIQH
jgi:hypothetical protein